MPLFRIFRDALHQRLKTLHAFTLQPVELPETGFEKGRNPHTDRMGDFFVRRGHVLGERYLEILGDPLEFHFFHDVDEGNDHTGGSGAPGASRPVDVGFPVVRRLVEEHMGEFGNVNAACGHVRGDEEPDGAFAQPGKDIFAAALGQVGGQLVGVESKTLQYGGHEVHRSLGIAENDGGGRCCP